MLYLCIYFLTYDMIYMHTYLITHVLTRYHMQTLKYIWNTNKLCIIPCTNACLPKTCAQYTLHNFLLENVVLCMWTYFSTLALACFVMLIVLYPCMAINTWILTWELIGFIEFLTPFEIQIIYLPLNQANASLYHSKPLNYVF